MPAREFFDLESRAWPAPTVVIVVRTEGPGSVSGIKHVGQDFQECGLRMCDRVI